MTNPEKYRKIGPGLVGQIHARFGALVLGQVVPCEVPVDADGERWLAATVAEVEAAGFKEEAISDAEAAAHIQAAAPGFSQPQEPAPAVADATPEAEPVKAADVSSTPSKSTRFSR